MSTHNIGFYEDLTKNYLSIIIKFHQIRTLSLLLLMILMEFEMIALCKNQYISFLQSDMILCFH